MKPNTQCAHGIVGLIPGGGGGGGGGDAIGVQHVKTITIFGYDTELRFKG